MITLRLFGFSAVLFTFFVLKTQLLKIWKGAERWFCLVVMEFEVMEVGIPVNGGTFSKPETWLERLKQTGKLWLSCGGLTFSLLAADETSGAGKPLVDGRWELTTEVSKVELDCAAVAGTYPQAMWDNSRRSLRVTSS